MVVENSHYQDEEATRLRTDAARNRERILRAARATFAARGIDAPMTTVARKAGVGVATLYRRFPSRDALVSEVFAEQFDHCTALLDDALADPDPWNGLCTLLHAVTAMLAADRGFTEAFFARHPDHVDDDRLAHAENALAPLVRKCREAGRVRTDVTAGDITLALIANAGLVTRLPQPGRAAARLTAQLLRGFATDTTGPLPPAPELRLRPLLLGHGLPNRPE